MIAEIVANNIKKRREEKGMTQEEAGEILGMSRATYNGVENGKRPVAVDELEKLANHFGVAVDSFFGRPRDTIKFEQMYLRVLENYPEGLPKTKLAKLLYLIDFSNFYEELEPMSGVDYIRRKYGPVAENFFEVTDDLYERGEIDIIPTGETLLIKLTTREPARDMLFGKDRERIDKICEIWRGRRTAEIVAYTHHQNPWRSCFDGERIPYELIVQEEPENVYTPA